MKKLIIGAALGSLILPPVVFSISTTKLTKNYSHHAKVSNYKRIDADAFIASDDSTIPLRFRNFRAWPQTLTEIPGITLKPKKTKMVKNNFGPLKIKTNVDVTTNINFQNVKRKADLFYNDLYNVYLIGNYKSIFSTEEARQEINEILENMTCSRSLMHSEDIRIVFMADKEARSVAGNMIDDKVTVSVNINDDHEKIKDQIYYVLTHEMMHLENEIGGIKGSLIYDSVMDDDNKEINRMGEGEEVMRRYGSFTGRPQMANLGKSLTENLFQNASINNSFIGNIPNVGYTTLSGAFESEVTHLYSKPSEAIVEDTLSFTIGKNHAHQYNNKFTGLLGSMGYRISSNVSLLNLNNRALISKKILQNTIDFTELVNDVVEGDKVYSSAYAVKQYNRTKIGFYTNKPIKLNGKVKTTANGKSYDLDLNSYETNTFIRTEPFGDEVLRYNLYYNQITLPFNDEIQTLGFEYHLQTADTNAKLFEKALGTMVNKHFPTGSFIPPVNTTMNIVPIGGR